MRSANQSVGEPEEHKINPTKLNRSDSAQNQPPDILPRQKISQPTCSIKHNRPIG
jgi:hypothetical protein